MLKLIHRPDVDHASFQPCMIIYSLLPHENDFLPLRLRREVPRIAKDVIVALFGEDYDSRRDLCFGGMAPWEKSPTA